MGPFRHQKISINTEKRSNSQPTRQTKPTVPPTSHFKHFFPRTPPSYMQCKLELTRVKTICCNSDVNVHIIHYMKKNKCKPKFPILGWCGAQFSSFTNHSNFFRTEIHGFPLLTFMKIPSQSISKLLKIVAT